MDYLFVSPHFDDVALSCGGWVSHLARTGRRAAVLTVCAGRPGNAPLSAFARVQHRQWGEPRDPIAARLREDGKAVRLLGAEPVYLDVPDAIYRRKANGRPLVNSGRTLFGRGYAPEATLIAHIARQIKSHTHGKRSSIIVAPLGAGRHVDHLLTRDAVRSVLAAGYMVLWYEDFPYAEARGAVTRARHALGRAGWIAAAHPIDVRRKIRAVAAYASQMHSTFRGPADMARRVEAYARRTAGGDDYAERIWAIGGTVLE
ncbi:MAG: PIG-L family deacetylase [Chloroflexi bacterium]|nr:PIG-L family deacetylase [Chloroflexota bacterium]